MNDYLLDTVVISALLEPKHKFHESAKAAIAAIPAQATQYISAVSLAELSFGAKLHEASGGMSLEKLTKIIADAATYDILEISRHTAEEYAQLKVNIAKKYLKDIKKDRKKYLDDWIDAITDKTLQIGENDLWICAHARERNLILVTADEKMDRIRQADSTILLKQIN